MADARELVLCVGCWIYPQEVMENPKMFGGEEKVRRMASRTKDLLYNFSHEKMEALFDLTGLLDIFKYYERCVSEDDSEDPDIIKALRVLRENQNKNKRAKRVRRSRR